MPANTVSSVSRARLPRPASSAWRTNSSEGGGPWNWARSAWRTKWSKRMGLQSEGQEHHAGGVVGDEDEDDGVDDGVVGGAADAGGAAGGVEAEVAGEEA